MQDLLESGLYYDNRIRSEIEKRLIYKEKIDMVSLSILIILVALTMFFMFLVILLLLK